MDHDLQTTKRDPRESETPIFVSPFMYAGVGEIVLSLQRCFPFGDILIFHSGNIRDQVEKLSDICLKI